VHKVKIRAAGVRRKIRLLQDRVRKKIRVQHGQRKRKIWHSRVSAKKNKSTAG